MRVKKSFSKGKATLALGEVTGHSHRTDKDVFFKANNEGLAQELVCEEPVSVLHEEHDTVKLDKGEYKVVLQREYDVVEGTRQVLD